MLDKPETALDLFVRLEKDRNRVRKMAGTLRVKPADKLADIKRKQLHHERINRLLFMIDTAKISKILVGLDVFYSTFGLIIEVDLLSIGIVAQKGAQYPKGRFLQEEASLKQTKLTVEYQIKELVEAPGAGNLKAWLRRRRISYDIYGRRVV